jgi:hypothetical protein
VYPRYFHTPEGVYHVLTVASNNLTSRIAHKQAAENRLMHIMSQAEICRQEVLNEETSIAELRQGIAALEQFAQEEFHLSSTLIRSPTFSIPTSNIPAE